MSPLAEPVHVECYSGARADEIPRAVWVDDERVELRRILEDRVEETHPERLRRRRLVVETAAGDKWTLTYDEATRTWWLERPGR